MSDESLARLVPPERWAARVRELRAENDRLRAALRFYADGGFYETAGGWRKVDWALQVRAREALAGPLNADRPGQSPAGETHKVQGRTP